MNFEVEQMSLSHDEPMTEPSPSVDPKAPLLGEIGSLQTRLARTQAEIRAAQAVRYEVFYREMGGRPSEGIHQTERDQDAFDPFCDHLLVIDAVRDDAEVVGTYRMMRKAQAERAGGFYSQLEYNLAPLLELNQGANLLELGRSCVLSNYRNKRTMELLWHGTWSHAVANRIDIMFGCASFEGTDPTEFADSLSWLADNAVLDCAEDCPAIVPNPVKLCEIASTMKAPKGVRQAMAKMPPLIKGYLRLGAKVATHAVIDEQFGTIDLLVVLKVAQINPRYLAHFGVDASRFTV